MPDPVLAHERVTAGPSEPSRWLYVLHGIFGAGRNWASLMRRVVRARPEWGVLLVDLREHGASLGLEGPHTIAAAAADLTQLVAHTGTPPTAVLGHSFGGKVALLFARAEQQLRQVWVVDSTPAPAQPGGSAWTMLQLLRTLPTEFVSRDALIDQLVAHGIERGVAQWMATNLESRDGVFRWRFDLDSMESLLESFFSADAWDVVERPAPPLEVHVVKAEKSSVLSGAVLTRLEQATTNGRTFLHRVDGGHWVNADNPAAIEQLLVQLLPTVDRD